MRFKIKDVPANFRQIGPSLSRYWVGIVLPMVTEEDFRADPPHGFFVAPGDSNDFFADREVALQALRQAGHLDAADHWAQLDLGPYFRFNAEACELLLD